MATPDLSALSSSFVEYGGQIFGKSVLDWNLRGQGIEVRTNVNTPQALPKISANAGPRPYRAQDDTQTTPKFTDRILTAYQSKWDWDFDSQEFRNTYLADVDNASIPFYEYALGQVAKEYLDQIQRLAIYAGVRNAGGTAPADLCDGWGKIIADLVTATTLTPVVTGTPTNANCVTKVELVTAAVPSWMRERGYLVYCSYTTFDKYTQHYRTLNGYQFQPGVERDYKIDNQNAFLRPVAWMGSSNRMVATIPGNLVFGTDIEQISIASSVRRNIIEVRQMMPVGCQIKDTEAIIVNDAA